MQVLALAQHQVTVLADPGTSGLKTWLNDNVVQLLVLLVGVVMLFAGLKAQAGKVIMVGGLSLIGLLFLGLGTSDSARQQLSRFLMGLVGMG